MYNWDETIRTAVIAIIVTITINLIIGVTVLLYRNTLNINEITASNLSAEQLKQFDKYNDRQITGAEVALFLEKQRSTKEIGVIVYNGKSTKQYIRGIKINGSEAIYDDTSLIDNAGKISSQSFTENYIKPSDLYQGRLYKNKADVIVAIRFEQQ